MGRLRIGARVEVKRIDGEPMQGYILRGPLEYLRHIGDFYHVGLAAPEAPKQRGRPRKGEERTEPAPGKGPEFGMYEGRDIRTLAGAPLKIG